jgi:hypothetical protein
LSIVPPVVTMTIGSGPCRMERNDTRGRRT